LHRLADFRQRHFDVAQRRVVFGQHFGQLQLITDRLQQRRLNGFRPDEIV
jgi:hypothetical protein